MLSFVDLDKTIETFIHEDKYRVYALESEYLINLSNELKKYDLKAFYIEDIVLGKANKNFFWINDVDDKEISIIITTMKYHNENKWTIRFKSFNEKAIAEGDFHKDIYACFEPKQFAKLCYDLKQIAKDDMKLIKFKNSIFNG